MVNREPALAVGPTLPWLWSDRMLRVAKLAVDITILLTATAFAFVLRFDGELQGGIWAPIALATLVLGSIKLVGYLSLRLYARSWGTVTFRDLAAIITMVAWAALPATALLLVFGTTLGIPRSIPLVDALLTLSAMSGARALARFERERRRSSAVDPSRRKRVLVVGAGESGAMAVRELLRHPETGMRPVGYVDDDDGKVGMRIAGVPVLGRLLDVRRVVAEQHVDEVLIAMPSEGGQSVRRVIELVKKAAPEVSYKIIPGMYEVLSGKVDVKRIRDVDISDLLGRPPVRLDVGSILGYLQGKRVMITGAGGSIGSELVRQICRFQPSELILFGHGENSIYSLERELDRDWPEIRYHGVIGAIQNGARLDYVFARYRPDVVFHAAAHKHVPLMEQNPEEAVFNNIIGSRNLISLALKYQVSHFVNISTDKAVNPSSVMGASKRMVEYLVHDAAHKAHDDQVFVSVRFGNVLGSRGSVIPIFKSQIQAGGPVTITHPDMVRYFMTIPEAAQLVLQASSHGRNGEVYILDMGEPVRIVDLARDLIRLSGFEPDVDIAIEFTGMRPGEKLSEMLMTENEKSERTPHEKIFVANVEPADHVQLNEVIDSLQHAAHVSDHDEIRAILEGFLDGCRFPGRGKVQETAVALQAS